MNEIVQRQLENEELAINLGIDTYIARYRQAGASHNMSELKPEQYLIKRNVLAISDHAKQTILTTTRGNKVWHATRNAIAEAGFESAAFITLQELLNIQSPTPAASVAVRIGKKIKQHIDYMRFRKEMPKYVDTLIKELDSDNVKYKWGAMKHYMNKKGVQEYELEDREHVGMFMLFRTLEVVDLFEVTLQSNGKKTTRMVSPTPLTVQWLESAHNQIAEMSCHFLPMLLPPSHWNSMYSGGFLNCAGQYHISAVRISNKATKQAMAKKESMSRVFHTLNTLQDTPWRINRTILETIKVCHEMKLDLLPQDLELTLPAPCWSTEEEYETLKVTDPERIKEWKIKRSEAYDDFYRGKSKRKTLHWQLWTADRFKDEPQIYFVWTADWRGRLYPIQPHLNPQSNHIGKALLEFANGVAVGEHGGKWLAIHGANTFGKDKLPMAERIKWVYDNQDLILDSANNPMEGERFWMKADEPFLFLAFCLEWAGFVVHGADHVSHLPMAVDGSCSGLQHYSALLKDEIGGRAVNLTPHERPSDIYMQVADIAKEVVAADTESEMAALWNGRIDRTIAKRNTMTWAYSATLWGFSDQLLNELKSRGGDYFGTGNSQIYRKAAAYMAKVNLDSIGKVVVKAVEGMKWLQEVVQIIAKDGHTMEWITPSGMWVRHNYNQIDSVPIKTLHGNTNVRIYFGLETDRPDVAKHKSAIAPNFIHSLDASHLSLTVRKCAERGITSFAMIHDSFGCPVGQMEIMASTLREAFIEMYSADILGDLMEQLREQLPSETFEKLPMPPKSGILDLNQVRDSIYFFA